jgi:hypothetical protein
MSTKTNFKRIALVAVTSLGFGVLTSVAPANATLDGITFENVSYSAALSSGVCSNVTNDASAAGSGRVLDATENAAQSGEILVGGSIGFTTANVAFDNANESMTVAITGAGQIATTVVASTSTRVFSAGLTSLTYVSTGTSTVGIDNLRVTPTAAGALQVTISTATAAGVSTTLERYNFTVSPTCVTGAFSVANSLVQAVYLANVATSAVPTVNTANSTSANTAAGTGSLAESATRIANGGTGYIAVRIMDGQSTPVNVTAAGIFSATATNGAVVSWALSDSLQSSSSVEAVGTGAQFNTVAVYQGLANKNSPLTTVVSISYNGVLIASRTINFTGKATKVTIDSANAGIGKASTPNINTATYEITDSAGNKLTTEGPGITGESGAAGVATNIPLRINGSTVADTVNQSIVTAAASDIATEASAYLGYFGWTCGSNATGGKANITVKYTFSDLTSLVSNTHAAQCGSTPVNYKASLDKASYLPGDIATLTITATDSKGNAVYDVDGSAAGVVVGTAGATTSISVTLPQLTAVSTPTNSDTFVGGKKTYKFTVGTTEGSFAGVVDLPAYNSTTYSQTAQTLSYKVAASSATVSNADVLKSIVALIASINKQIQALQKLILKR